MKGRLAAPWRYDTDTIRLVDPNSATRLNRGALDPRWSAVRAISFGHDGVPITRKRRRGAGKPRAILAGIINLLAATGELPELMPGSVNEIATAYGMSEPEAARWVFDKIKTVAELFTNHAFVDLVETLGPVEAAQWLLTRTNASRARFSSANDVDAPEQEGA